MSFLNASNAARLKFSREVKRAGIALTVIAEFDPEENLCFVYGLDGNDDVQAVASFTMTADAWTPKSKKEIEKLFTGTANIAVKGRA